MAVRETSEDARLAVLASHPIQYLSPWFRHLSERLWVKVYYAHRQSASDQSRAGFRHSFDWDVPLLEGYSHEWLPNVARRPGVDRFAGCDTPQIGGILARDRASAVLAFGWRHKSIWQALLACRRLGIPMIMRGDSTLQAHASGPRRLLRGLTHPRLLPRFDAHLYVGEANRRYLARYGVPSERLFFAPHAIDNERFRRAAGQARGTGECARLRRDLGIAPGAFVYMFVGKLTPGKRVGDLVEAFRLSRATRPERDAHLVVVGDGHLRGSLARQASRDGDRIHLVGFRNQSVLPGWLAMADTLVVPGCETWGLVVNEAAACGVPALASERVGCVDDLVDPGHSGLVFRHADVRDLAAKLAEIRDLSHARPGAVAAALERKCAQYSYERATAGLMRALESVTGPRSRASERAGSCAAAKRTV